MDKLNDLLEQKSKYITELKRLEGIKRYSKEKQQNKIHNIINISIFIACLTAIGGASIFIATKNLVLGLLLLGSTIISSGIGIKIFVNAIKNGEYNKNIRKFYKDNYGLDIQNLNLNKQGLSHLNIQIHRNQKLLEITNNEIISATSNINSSTYKINPLKRGDETKCKTKAQTRVLTQKKQ